MDAFDLVVRNGTVVTPQGRLDADVGIAGGRIAALCERGVTVSSRAQIDATGLVVLPGAIDCHVHFRDPGFTHKEDFATGTQAAAAGGVTTVIDMPNTDPVTESAETVSAKQKIAESKAVVDFGLYGLITGQGLEEIPRMAAAGVVGFKVFMARSVSPIRCPDDGQFLAACRAAAAVGLRIGVHAENSALLDWHACRLQAAGRTDASAHYEARPNIAEREAIERAILLAAEGGCSLHIFHMSSREGVEAVRRARQRGQDVSAETCPHYLLLDHTMVETLGSVLKMNPPVRTPFDQRALWEGLLDGTIGAIATDHSPHTEEEKTRPNIWEAVAGFTGVETSMPLLLTEVNRGRLSLSQYVRVAAENPARIWGLYPRKGVIQVGSDADLAIVDMTMEGIVTSDDLHSRTRVTPFSGYHVRGRPLHTIVRGQVVMREGAVVDRPVGRMVARGEGRG